MCLRSTVSSWGKKKMLNKAEINPLKKIIKQFYLGVESADCDSCPLVRQPQKWNETLRTDLDRPQPTPVNHSAQCCFHQPKRQEDCKVGVLSGIWETSQDAKSHPSLRKSKSVSLAGDSSGRDRPPSLRTGPRPSSTYSVAGTPRALQQDRKL